MHRVRLIFISLFAAACFACNANADFKITIPDVSFVNDLVNPTTGSFPVLLEVDGAGAPNVGAPISSYNFQLDVTAVGGGLTTVTSLTGSAGDLFTGVTSQEFPFSVFDQGVSPLGFSEGATSLAQPTAPAPGTLNTTIVLTNIAFSVPAGQIGTFDVDFTGLEIFDDGFPTADPYLAVAGTGGTVTITAIPEPSSFLLFTLIGTVAIVVRKFWRS